MNHLEFAASESAALIETDWERWATKLETIMGHSIDGDSLEDGYSADEAYDMWKEGHTVYAASYAFKSRGQYKFGYDNEPDSGELLNDSCS